jgi:hypothetical protein
VTSSLIIKAAPNCHCVDSIETFTDDQLDALWALGMRAIGVYATIVTAATLARYVAKGFLVFFCTTSRAPGWQPSAATGKADGVAAIAKLAALGVPAGVTLYNDFETPATGASSGDRIAHVDAFAASAIAVCRPGVYIGASTALTSAEWYMRPQIVAYAESCSDVRDFQNVPIRTPRGWQWQQFERPNQNVAGANVDFGALHPDFRGDVVQCVGAPTP